MFDLKEKHVKEVTSLQVVHTQLVAAHEQMVEDHKTSSDTKHRKMQEQNVTNFTALAQQHSDQEEKLQLLQSDLKIMKIEKVQSKMVQDMTAKQMTLVQGELKHKDQMI